MKFIRRLHAWLGVVFAPSIVLFAVSGLLQMYGAHEGEAPMGWVQRIAQIHMKQSVELPQRRARPPAATAATTKPEGEPHVERPAEGGERTSTLPLKLFFTLVSLGLILSTSLGVYMAFTPKRDRKLFAALLAAGVLIPTALLLV